MNSFNIFDDVRRHMDAKIKEEEPTDEDTGGGTEGRPQYSFCTEHISLLYTSVTSN